jgi:hypothetical protein
LTPLRTLQELIAPSNIRIYTKSWTYIGTRRDYAQCLADITHIDYFILVRGTSSWDDLSIAQRMSWASQRQTTRPEDLAYCLFGLFDVHLPPLYGEGAVKAFRRLQEEIIKNSTDLTILAWTPPKDDGGASSPFIRAPFIRAPFIRAPFIRALAESPACFAGCGNIRELRSANVEPFRMTNKGLRLKIEIAQCDGIVLGRANYAAVLQNCHDGTPWQTIALNLCKTEDDVWWRLMVPVYSIGLEELGRAQVQKIYLAA